MVAPKKLAIEQEKDIATARLEAWSEAVRIGLSKFASVKVATAVSELARNIVFYAGKGTVELRSLKDDRGVTGLQIIASRPGAGHPAGQARRDLGRHLQIATRHGQGSGGGQEAGGRLPARHAARHRHHRDLRLPGGTLKTGGFSRPYKGLSICGDSFVIEQSDGCDSWPR